MRLFLCEKPSQAREISKHVGANKRGDGCVTGTGVAVTWAIGHLVELAKPEHYEPALKSWDINLLPVVPQAWTLLPKDKTRDQLKIVQKLLKQADEVVIATDADREGEVIARELMQLSNYTGKVSRLWLSAFDDASIKKALGKLLPGGRTVPMYFSGMGRSHADWLAGMNLTMALTKAFGTGGKEGTLHCGRVQTPVLALIVRRERAIANFKPVTHYQLTSVFELSGTAVPMTWLPDEALMSKDSLVTDRAKVEEIAQRVSGRTGRVVTVEAKNEHELAPLPYSLGSLQREASARSGMKAQAVLDAAQSLYEKHKATSYPRTDCEYLPRSMLTEAQAVLDAIADANCELIEAVGQARGALTGAFSGRAFNDDKITAHHAIIPTQHPGVDRGSMTKDERTIYDMVCRRYLVQFLGSYQFLKTTILVACEGERFRVSGKTPKVMGWRTLDPERAKSSTSSDDAEHEPTSLPPVEQGDPACNLKCELAVRKTSPPKRYTEGTLLAAMESIDKEIEDPRWKAVMKNKEKAGIGTDATRSVIIEGLFRRDYIEAVKKELHPTSKGSSLVQLIERVAPEVADPVMTAQWEEDLGRIERGEIELIQFEQSLAEWLERIIEGIRGKAGTFEIEGGGARAQPGVRASRPQARQDQGQGTDVKYPCPKCQKPLRLRSGSNGPFWGCSGYPECRHTQPDDGGKPGVRTDDVQGRTSSRERQQTTAPAAAGRAGEACPSCGKGLLVAKTLKDSGKPFVGCNRFPACRHFAWPEKK